MNLMALKILKKKSFLDKKSLKNELMDIKLNKSYGKYSANINKKKRLKKVEKFEKIEKNGQTGGNFNKFEKKKF